MVQERLRASIDDKIVPFQYGYRRGKSTAEPIFIARRTQDLAERAGTPLYLLALDYSKAFDSIPHDKLLESLRRKGASEKNIALVAAIYHHPKFRIKIPEGISEEKPQDIGIRQGCPLSPYLYIISTSCLMLDLLKDLEREEIEPPPGTIHPTLFFADDTLLLSETAPQMTKILDLVISHSKHYNLTLNTAKCQLLVTNDPGHPVNFPDGSPVQKHDQIKYLGTIFCNNLDVNLIVRQKIADASATLRQLQPLWTHQNISPAWKLIVFNAIIRTRIFYTLETAELSHSHQKHLDTLYYRALRKILKKPSTFIDRAWTHERLLNTANSIAKATNKQAATHTDFSKYYKIQRRKLLGHLLRAPLNHPGRKAVLTEDGRDLSEINTRKRVGRPRYTWFQEALQEAWEEYSAAPFIISEAITHLEDLARRRTPPFARD